MTRSTSTETVEQRIAEFVAARDRAFIEMDFDYVRNQCGRNMSDELCELTIHKARYECTAIAAEYRHASAKWLRERGYKRLIGTDLLPEGELPK